MRSVIAKDPGVNPDFPVRDWQGCGVILADTLLSLQRLQSLAFGFETSAYAEDRAFSPLDGLLQDYPAPLPMTCRDNCER
jgi:hypothetical protein